MEILDSPGEADLSKRELLVKILSWSIIGILGFYVIETFREEIPVFKIPGSHVEISIVGVLILTIIFGLVNAFTKFQNDTNLKWSNYRIAIQTGLILFFVEITFKVLQEVSDFPIGFQLNFFKLIRIGIVMGTISFLYSNYRIRKIRNNDTTGAKWLFWIIFFGIGFLTSKLNGI